MKLFAINLERSTDRRRHIEAQLAQVGVPFEIAAAVDGQTLSPKEKALYDPVHALEEFGVYERMNAAEIACYLSHYRLYERMVRDNTPSAIILEDDVVLRPDFASAVAALSKTTAEWDLVLLGDARGRPYRIVEPLANDWALVRLYYSQPGAFAYAVSLKGAQKLVRRLMPIAIPIDIRIQRFWELSLSTFAVRPAPVGLNHELQEASTIGYPRGKHSATRGSAPRRLGVLVKSRQARFRDSCLKRLWVWRRYGLPFRLTRPG